MTTSIWHGSDHSLRLYSHIGYPATHIPIECRPATAFEQSFTSNNKSVVGET